MCAVSDDSTCCPKSRMRKRPADMQTQHSTQIPTMATHPSSTCCRLRQLHDACDVLLHIAGGGLFLLVWLWHLTQPASRLPGAKGWGWFFKFLTFWSWTLQTLQYNTVTLFSITPPVLTTSHCAVPRCTTSVLPALCRMLCCIACQRGSAPLHIGLCSHNKATSFCSSQSCKLLSRRRMCSRPKAARLRRRAPIGARSPRSPTISPAPPSASPPWSPSTFTACTS